MPCEVEAAGVAGDRQDEGEGIVIHHVVSHVEELRVQTWRSRAEELEVYKLRRIKSIKVEEKIHTLKGREYI